MVIWRAEERRCAWRMKCLPTAACPLIQGLVICLSAICPAETLLCHCTDPYEQCKDANFTCKIDAKKGVCATYWRSQHRGARMEWSCLEHGDYGVDKLSCHWVENRVHVICCRTDFCNGNLTVPAPNVTFPTILTGVQKVTVPSERDIERDLEIALPFAFFVVALLVASAVYSVHRRRKKRQAREHSSQQPFAYRSGANGRANGDSMASSYDSFNVSRMLAHPIGGMVRPPPVTAEQSNSVITSGSGSGASYLVQRTLAREIELRTCIGRGRFGEVHSGVWQGEDVAVKIFYSRDEQSWLCETQIYNSVLLRHEHILTFYGSDVRSNFDCTELWLITQYHEKGSLYDFLVENEIDVETALKFAYSIASGLNHLHTEIQGTCGKRSIAHRDLKSKNILVKDDLNCCIADLGLAVMHDPDSDKPPDVPDHKVGTKRYMSPEMLSESINVHRFNAFRCADVYALGLVLWEVGRRCKVNGEVMVYELPYFEHLLSDPSVEEVHQVVVVDKHRPVVPEHLSRDMYTRHIGYTMVDCWREDPSSRVTALRIKKTFYELKKKRSLPPLAEEEENVGDPTIRLGRGLPNGAVVHLPPQSSSDGRLPTNRTFSNGVMPSSHSASSGSHPSHISAMSDQSGISLQSPLSVSIHVSSSDAARSSPEQCTTRATLRLSNGHVNIGGWSHSTSVGATDRTSTSIVRIESVC